MGGRGGAGSRASRSTPGRIGSMPRASARHPMPACRARSLVPGSASHIEWRASPSGFGWRRGSPPAAGVRQGADGHRGPGPRQRLRSRRVTAGAWRDIGTHRGQQGGRRAPAPAGPQARMSRSTPSVSARCPTASSTVGTSKNQAPPEAPHFALLCAGWGAAPKGREWRSKSVGWYRRSGVGATAIRHPPTHRGEVQLLQCRPWGALGLRATVKGDGQGRGILTRTIKHGQARIADSEHAETEYSVSPSDVGLGRLPRNPVSIRRDSHVGPLTVEFMHPAVRIIQEAVRLPCLGLSRHRPVAKVRQCGLSVQFACCGGDRVGRAHRSLERGADV